MPRARSARPGPPTAGPAAAKARARTGATSVTGATGKGGGRASSPRSTTTKAPDTRSSRSQRSAGAPVGARRRTGEASSGTGAKAAPARRTLLGRRYAVVYDIDGPRVRLGLLWFGGVVAALAIGWPAVVLLYAAAAGWAAMQAAATWVEDGSGADRIVAAMGAGGLVVAAAFGSGLLGVAALVLVAVALGVSALSAAHRVVLVEAAGTTVQCALFAGLAGAGVVLSLRLEIGAAVVLIVLVAAYEVGDYLIGSGAGNALEGPAAGIVAIAVVTIVVVVLDIPPFDGADAFTFGALAAIGCPLGQLLGSVILPRADAAAPALRRLDSLFLLGPAWPLLVGLYMDSMAG